eukprot:TRINITY_DN17871_c0_g2_i1.p1 TRINITY_DN17871_c0_g2~~TRINITY_DN17871_c0_g2_i1.p1  ORF type:complete len:1237 (-),score=245.60 TRINITY_DN17871_c0_g2_i1:92-3766(-)
MASLQLQAHGAALHCETGSGVQRHHSCPPIGVQASSAPSSARAALSLPVALTPPVSDHVIIRTVHDTRLEAQQPAVQLQEDYAKFISPSAQSMLTASPPTISHFHLNSRDAVEQASSRSAGNADLEASEEADWQEARRGSLLLQQVASDPAAEHFGMPTEEQIASQRDVALLDIDVTQPVEEQKDTAPSTRDGSVQPSSCRSHSAIESFGGYSRQSRNSRVGPRSIAGCPLCQVLFHCYSDGRLTQALDSDAISARVQRALTFQIDAGEEAECSESLCQFHRIHRQRFELWMRSHVAVTQHGSTEVDASLEQLKRMGELVSVLENAATKAEGHYEEMVGQSLRNLHEEIRERRRQALQEELKAAVEIRQREINEIDAAVQQKAQQRRRSHSEASRRLHNVAKDEFSKFQRRRSLKKLQSCVEDHRNFRGTELSSYAKMLRDAATEQRVCRDALELEAEAHAACRVERELGRKERNMDIWIEKMQKLQDLNEFRASQAHQKAVAAIDRNLKRLEEDQMREFRQVVAQIQNHVVRLRHMVGKATRLSTTFAEPFWQTVVRSELACLHGATKRPGLSRSQSQPPLQLCDAAANDDGASKEAAAIVPATPLSRRPSRMTGELKAFAEFLAKRFLSLQAVMKSMDMTKTGRVVCFELQAWLRQHHYVGDARALLKDLDRDGHRCIGLPELRQLASDFVAGSLQHGRPPGTTAAALATALHGRLPKGTSRSPHGVFQCVANILSFASSSKAAVFPSTGGTPEVEACLLAGLPACASSPSHASESFTKGLRESPAADVSRRAHQMLYLKAEDRRFHMRHGTSAPFRGQSRSPSPSVRSRPLQLDQRPNPGTDVLTASQRGSFFRYSNARYGGAPPPKCAKGSSASSAGTPMGFSSPAGRGSSPLRGQRSGTPDSKGARSARPSVSSTVDARLREATAAANMARSRSSSIQRPSIPGNRRCSKEDAAPGTAGRPSVVEAAPAMRDRSASSGRQDTAVATASSMQNASRGGSASPFSHSGSAVEFSSPPPSATQRMQSAPSVSSLQPAGSVGFVPASGPLVVNSAGAAPWGYGMPRVTLEAASGRTAESGPNRQSSARSLSAERGSLLGSGSSVPISSIAAGLPQAPFMQHGRLAVAPQGHVRAATPVTSHSSMERSSSVRVMPAAPAVNAWPAATPSTLSARVAMPPRVAVMPAGSYTVSMSPVPAFQATPFVASQPTVAGVAQLHPTTMRL